MPSHGRRIDVASCRRLLLWLWPETACLTALTFSKKSDAFYMSIFCNVFVVIFLCRFMYRSLRQSEHEPQNDHLRAFPSILFGQCVIVHCQRWLDLKDLDFKKETDRRIRVKDGN